MEILTGKYSSAKVYAASLEDYARTQILSILENPASKSSNICLMPDCHPGKTAPIGLTMTVENIILPSLVGIDAGCGVTTALITRHRGLEFKQLDSVIRDRIPAGCLNRKIPHRFALDFDFSQLNCRRHVSLQRSQLSLGTLGGGNHFIEIDKDEKENVFLTVHSGSRHLGKEMTEHYMNTASRTQRGQGVPYEWTYLEGLVMNDYIEDLCTVQDFARLNRLAIIDDICKGMKWKYEVHTDCPHNFVEATESEIMLRKGAIRANLGENVIIPINMKDGIILGKGRGNSEWNFSAPHGSGRTMKREDIRKNFTVSAFKKTMAGIYSSCIGDGTLDEAPFAYRGIDEIQNAISPTVEVTSILKPVYNFKAGGE